MNSRVINFVAGGGKTTYSRDYMLNHNGGIYIAFTNSVVNDMRDAGLLSLTISSLFSSFILPKMLSHIPLIASGSKIIYSDDKILGCITIKEDGRLFNGSAENMAVSLNTQNEDLHKMNTPGNSLFHLKKIFGPNSTSLNHQQRDSLSWFLLEKYPEKILSIISSRFDYVIIDEAQDIKKGFMQKFAELLYDSDIELILIGDPYQNVNGGSDWFEKLKLADEVKTQSHRCPDGICSWIRENLHIEIYGNGSSGSCEEIKHEDVFTHDDGTKPLLYCQNNNFSKRYIEKWRGPKSTIKSIKGSTINSDVVIIGKTMSAKNLYTAITRTTKNAYFAIEEIKYDNRKRTDAGE